MPLGVKLALLKRFSPFALPLVMMANHSSSAQAGVVQQSCVCVLLLGGSLRRGLAVAVAAERCRLRLLRKRLAGAVSPVLRGVGAHAG